MNVLIGIITAFAAVSMPVSYHAEWKYGFGRRARLTHGICAVMGIISLAVVYLLFKWKVGSASGDVGYWANDFFFGYLWTALPAVLVITGLLSLAAAIRHPMKRIRMTLTVLLSVAVILATLFVAFLASDGQFAVDVYIRALAPGLGLLPHAVPLCERRKNSD